MKKLFSILLFTLVLSHFNPSSAVVNACMGTLDATTELNTSGGASATLVGNGTPGRIRICITVNNIGAGSCMGISERIYIYNSAGTFLTSWPATTASGTCYTLATCDGYVRMRRWCWSAGSNATITYETLDCATATVNQCYPAHCLSGIQDGDETWVDCGGSCPACTPCNTNETCATAIATTPGVTVTGCNFGAAVGPLVPTAPLCDMSVTPTVWYSFTTSATETAAIIDLESTCMTLPQFAIWSDCGTVLSTSCTIGNGLTYTPLTPSTTYYVAVSDYGGLECPFDLTVTPFEDAAACLTGYTLTASAAGPYTAGQTVNFTFTVTDWNKAACNWLQGIVPDWGPCWDDASFTSSAPTGGATNGTWTYTTAQYNVATTQFSVGETVGPGWFFVRTGDPGAATSDPDGTWGNTGGCGGNACNNCDNDFTFNFSLTVQNVCDMGTDCQVSIKTFGDGEVGNWSSPGCQSDLPKFLYLTADPNLCPLSVEYLDFSGEQFEGRNRIFWSTASETDNAYFIVERSSNGRDFENIAVINGSGTSNHIIHYEAFDNNPIYGTNYYRLRQVDKNGKVSLSRMIAINTKAEIVVINSYPNPTEDIFNLEVSLKDNANYVVEILDMSGRLIVTHKYALNKGNQLIEIPVDELSSGFYYVSFTKEGNTSRPTEMIKMMVK